MSWAIALGIAFLTGWYWGGIVMPKLSERRAQKSFQEWRRSEGRELTEQAQEVLRMLERT